MAAALTAMGTSLLQQSLVSIVGGRVDTLGCVHQKYGFFHKNPNNTLNVYCVVCRHG